MTDDEDLEARLAHWQPAEPPPELMRCLRAMEPAARGRRGWPRWIAEARRPWPLAYAGLLAAWALILVLRLITPSASPEPVALAQTHLATNDAPSVAANFRAERAFFFARTTPDQL